MKAKDLFVVGGAALVTAVVAVALRTVTSDAIAVERASTAVPVLEADGATLTLELNQAAYKAGEQPIVILHAANKGEYSASVHVVVTMASVSLASSKSRMPTMPTQAWSASRDIIVEPQDTTTVELPTGVVVAAGSIISFSMTAGGKTVPAAGRFTVPGNAVTNGAVQSTQVQFAQPVPAPGAQVQSWSEQPYVVSVPSPVPG